MATPIVTGNAALVRQYLVDGFHQGKPINNPSSSLIRAIMYNGAAPLTHATLHETNENIVTPSAPYDNHQGMGLVRLSSSLPLENENEFGMQIYDQVEIRDGDTHTYGFLINDSCNSWDDISATLVWLDPAASSGCIRCLINDLDLHLKINEIKHYPNGMYSPDKLNTAERIRTPVYPGDFINVVISGSNIASSAFQNYSLVITGCFDEQEQAVTVSSDEHFLNTTTMVIVVICLILVSLGC